MTSFEPFARPDVWSATNTTTTVEYRVQAHAETDLLCRVLNLFAMQYLTPLQVAVIRQNDCLFIDVRIDELTWHRAEVIAQKMRNLISVISVELQPEQQPATLQAG